MAISVPTIEPTEIQAGDFTTWKITDTDYSAADGWALEYNLVNSAGQIVINASADGTGHLVEISAASTAAYSAGLYSYQARMTKTTQIYTIRRGTIKVLVNFESQTTGYDDRSFAKICLDAIEAVLQGKAGEDVLSYSIQNRSLSKFSHEELLAARDKYKAEWIGEEVSAGRKSRKVKVRFV